MSMHFHSPHPLQPFWNIAAAPMQAQALEQAIAHQLFDALAQPSSAQALASRLQLDPAATAVWLELLWSMQLLLRQDLAAAPKAPEYLSAPLAVRYFSAASPDNCSQAWQYRVQTLSRSAAQWQSVLQQGAAAGSAQAAAPQGSWAQAARAQIGQEQRAITVPLVLKVLTSLPPLPQTGRLLDLGGGPGHVGIALAQQLPNWQGFVCDQPETAEVARENIAQAGLAERMHAVGCDLDSDGIGHGYDLIWCSSVLHFLQQPQAALDKMAQALNAGGWLLLAHAERSTDAELAARVMPFYAGMLLRGHRLTQAGELAQMLAGAGLVDVRSLGRIDGPMAPLWLYAARKA